MEDNVLRAKIGRAPISLREKYDGVNDAAAGDTAEAMPSVEDLAPLPRPGDPYKAYSRPSSKPVLTLHFLLANAKRKGFSFADLREYAYQPSETPGGGMEIVLCFVAATTTEVKIEGRNLERLYDYLGDHRIRYVRELSGRDFREANEAVVTRIRIEVREE